MPSRREGLLSLLIASPMTLLGCTPDPVPSDPEGSSSSGPGPGSSSSGMADTGSTSIVTTGDDTTGTTGSTSTSGTTDAISGTSTTDAPTSSSGTTFDDTTSSEGGESTTSGADMGNTCERVGDLMDACFGGGGYYYNYYEQACNGNISYYIAAGDYGCAQAWNEYYACIADLDCAEVFMGAWSACQVQYGNVESVCFDWGGTDSFGDSGGFEDSGFIFIVPETSGGTGFGGSST